MKRYTTDWKSIIIVYSIVSIFAGVMLYINAESEYRFWPMVYWFGLSAFFILISTKYSYVTVSGHTLKFVYGLFQRRTVDIGSIIEISNQATYKVAKSAFRSVYIFYETPSGETKYIQLRVDIFPEKTIGELIRDLSAINADMNLDAYCERLLKKVEMLGDKKWKDPPVPKQFKIGLTGLLIAMSIFFAGVFYNDVHPTFFDNSLLVLIFPVSLVLSILFAVYMLSGKK